MIATAPKLVLLAGNPNTGKTSVFNRLTGLRLKVGNYPGITVERTSGRLDLPSGRIELADVPGTYSLAARSEEERIAIQAIAGLAPHERPDAVVIVVDVTQLSRNLYLALQIIELDVPVIIALNMTDMLAARGMSVDAAALARALGVRVVAISARTGAGFAELRAELDRLLLTPATGRPGSRWEPRSPALRADIDAVATAVPRSWHGDAPARRDALALWALLSLDDEDELAGVPPELRAAVGERRAAAAAAGRDVEDEIIRARYAWIDAELAAIQSEAATDQASWTDRVDRVLLHPVFGFALFLLMMGIVFQSLFTWSEPAIGLVESLIGSFGELVASVLPDGILADLVVGGVIEGVGAVLVFLPQILLLFFFIGLMEDSGYMARVAYLMDRVMKSLGLHGRAFVPMLSGFACAVPAILATRTMERRRDRLLTMLVVPLMTCSARLPVYTLLIAAIFAPSERLLGVLPVQASLMVAMYLFSTLIALAAAWVLGHTMLRGPSVPLLLEMPPYRMPHWTSVVRMMWMRTSIFVREAGTIILLCTIAMWGLLSFPRASAATAAATESTAAESTAAESTAAESTAAESTAAESIGEPENASAIRDSYGGRLGRALEPVIAPLGFDWKIGIGLIGAFAAREVFVSTMGVVYGLGEAEDETSPGLRERLRAERRADGSPVYTPLVTLSLMVFFALACQCMSTLAVIKRETASWSWTAFAFTYMTALAWIASFAVFQGGRFLGFA